MDYFKLFSKVFQDEKKKCNLYHVQILSSNNELSSSNGFFESPYDRCAYMYKYATCTLYFIKTCINNFLREYSGIKDLLLEWKSCSNLKFCSLSCGPALDYLAYTIALSESVEVELQPSIDNVTIVSKSAQWRNTLNFMIEAIEMGYLKDFPVALLCSNFTVVQDTFATFSKKQTAAVEKVEVLFMVKTLNLCAPNEQKIYIKEMVNCMKTGSILFCIDTKPSVALMTEVLCQVPGEFIYGPFLNKSCQLPEKFPENYKEIYGCLPVISNRGAFFVWKKMAVESGIELGELGSENSDAKNKVTDLLTVNAINKSNASTCGEAVSAVLNTLEKDLIKSIPGDKAIQIIPCPDLKPKLFTENSQTNTELTNMEVHNKILKYNDTYELSVLSNHCDNLIGSPLNVNNSFISFEKFKELTSTHQLHTHSIPNILSKNWDIQQITKPIDISCQTDIEYDVSIMLSQLCDIVSQGNNYNKTFETISTYSLKNEMGYYSDFFIREPVALETSSNVLSNEFISETVSSKSIFSEKENSLSQTSVNLSKKISESEGMCTTNCDSKSSVSNSSNTTQTISVDTVSKSAKRSAKKNKESLLLIKPETFETTVMNPSTSSAIVKNIIASGTSNNALSNEFISEAVLLSKSNYSEKENGLSHTYINVSENFSESKGMCIENCGSKSLVSNNFNATQTVDTVSKSAKRSKKNKNSLLLIKPDETNKTTVINPSTSSSIVKNDTELLKKTEIINDGSKSFSNIEQNQSTPNKALHANMLTANSITNEIPVLKTKKSIKIGTDSVSENITNSTSVQCLTDRIKKLVTSFETILTQNDKFKYPSENISGNCFKCTAPNTDTLLNSSSSIYSSPVTQNCFSNAVMDIPDEDSASKNFQNKCMNPKSINPENNPCDQHKSTRHSCLSCCGIHLRQSHCCVKQCGRVQGCALPMYKGPCSMHSSQHCIRQCFSHCYSSCRCVPHNQSCTNQTNSMVPNIVIPLQNISEDTLAQIISTLRAGSQTS